MSGQSGDDLIDPGFFSGDDSWGGSVTDKAQNEAIRSLRGQLAAERKRLSSEVRHIRGTLEQRLDRMATSFDAFVELSDVREQLVPFAGAALARRRVLAMLDGPVPEELHLDAPPPGAPYWLVPAAHGLHALLDGDLGGAQRRFSEAADADALRAGVFTLLAAAERAPEAAPALAEWILPGIMPEPPEEPAAYQRVLLLLAAEGRLGDGARERMLAGCRGMFGRAEPSAKPSEDFWKPLLGGVGKTGRPPAGLRGTRQVEEVLQAAVRVAALKGLVFSAFAGPDASGSSGPTPSDSSSASSSTPAQPSLSPSAASAPFTSGEVLRLLVEEGSEEEAPLLYRAAQLRAVVESGGDTSDDAPVTTWQDPTGPTLELLRDVGFSALEETEERPEAAAETRRFALEVFAPEVSRQARELAEQAGRSLPDGATVREHGVDVTVTRAGPEAASLEAARIRIPDIGAVQSASGLRLGAAFVGAGALAAVVAAAAQAEPVLWLLAAAGLAWAGWLFYRSMEVVKESAAENDHAHQRLEKKLASAAQTWSTYLSEAEQTQTRAREDAKAIERAMGAG